MDFVSFFGPKINILPYIMQLATLIAMLVWIMLYIKATAIHQSLPPRGPGRQEEATQGTESGRALKVALEYAAGKGRKDTNRR